ATARYAVSSMRTFRRSTLTRSRWRDNAEHARRHVRRGADGHIHERLTLLLGGGENSDDDPRPRLKVESVTDERCRGGGERAGCTRDASQLKKRPRAIVRPRIAWIPAVTPATR